MGLNLIIIIWFISVEYKVVLFISKYVERLNMNGFERGIVGVDDDDGVIVDREFDRVVVDVIIGYFKFVMLVLFNYKNGMWCLDGDR